MRERGQKGNFGNVLYEQPLRPFVMSSHHVTCDTEYLCQEASET